MVDPAARGRGIGTALLEAALPLCRERDHDPVLLIVPRGSAAGQAFAHRHRGRLDHSEHVMEMLDAPVGVPADPRVVLRPATRADLPAVLDLLELGFGWRPSGLEDESWVLSADPQGQRDRAVRLVVEQDGQVIGTVRTADDPRESDAVAIHGFVIRPDRRGRGIGRDVLSRLCSAARDAGARRIRLEVAVDNDRALALYTSIGFTTVTTEDYYAL